MRPHPTRQTAPAAARRIARVLALAAAACALPTAAVAQVSGDAWLAHRMAAADAAVLGPLAALRVAHLADTTDADMDGCDNAHVTLSEDEARADADLRMAIAIVRFTSPAAPPAVPTPWIDADPATGLSVVLSSSAAEWALLTVRLATQPGLQFDVGVLGSNGIVMRDARLQGAGGSANFSVQPGVVEFEWRQGVSVGWTSVLIGVQPQGVAARLIASIAL